MRTITTIGMLLCLWALPLAAQESKTVFSLDEAIVYALEHNYQAINADRDLVDAQKQKWEVIAGGLPQIDGSLSYQNQLKQQVVQLPGEIADGEPGTFVEVVFGQPQQMTAVGTLRQQIFDGSYIVGVQATKAFLDYSKNNKEKTDLDVRKGVVETYGNLLLAQESVAILEKNKITLEKNLYETQKIFENGLGDEESVDQLQITLSSVNNQLKNAERLVGITRQMLNLMMGLPLENPTEPSDDLDALTQQKIDPGFLETSLNLADNIDYKMVTNLNEQRFYELKLAKSRALPSLNAFINYGGISFGDQFTFFDQGQDWFGFSTLGVDLNVPIFSSLKRSASTQRAKIAYDKAKTQLEETEQQVRLQLERAKSDYTLSIEQYETSKDNLALAERIENKNQVKYSEGLATSFELRQAQTQLYDTQQEYLQSMVDVINQKTTLETILNTY
ncbi:MAG: TolC family protein [Bacteroidota bacterium]